MPAVPRSHVVVTRRLPAAVEAALAARYACTFNPNDVPLDGAALATALATADALVPVVGDRLDRAVWHLARDVTGGAPLRCRVVANVGVGVDHIDLEAARVAGVPVTNTPDVLTEDTADLALALLLMAARRLGEGERLVRAGRWAGLSPTGFLGTSPAGKTLGIVGYGRIGRALARKAHDALGMRVRYVTRGPVMEADTAPWATPAPSLDALLAESDVLSLHCPATPATYHLIDAAALARMRPGAVLVNTARGSIVDAAALAVALRDGPLAAAGLDVYEDEPRVPPALLALENVVLLPHLGSATVETRTAMGMRALANVDAVFAGRAPPDRVV
ncbi:MAG: D-glycerate dehydrogenase [Candidatus Eremiobacteraeota bacterium]|nr:D-glycerate dehydrogenase [Candidatus Eremiobacteraeota bacterium]